MTKFRAKQISDKKISKPSHDVRRFFVAQDRQANGCLHTNSFVGRKDMEHEVRNVCVQNRVGVSLLDYNKSSINATND